MAKYIKMTNGAVSVLVGIKETDIMTDLLSNGFYTELDSNDEVILIDSNEMASPENEDVAEILDMVKGKLKKMGTVKGTDETVEEVDLEEEANSLFVEDIV